MLVLDTHVIVWLAAKHRSLGAHARRAIDRALAGPGVAVSAFSFWEIATLVERGRLRGIRDARELRDAGVRAGIRELPVDAEIAIAAAGLRAFHGDPADRLIVATALANDAALVTADGALLGWKHAPRTIDATR